MILECLVLHIGFVSVGFAGCSFASLFCMFLQRVRGCIQVKVSMIQTITDYLMYKKGDNGLSEEFLFLIKSIFWSPLKGPS